MHICTDNQIQDIFLYPEFDYRADIHLKTPKTETQDTGDSPIIPSHVPIYSQR